MKSRVGGDRACIGDPLEMCLPVAGRNQMGKRGLSAGLDPLLPHQADSPPVDLEVLPRYNQPQRSLPDALQGPTDHGGLLVVSRQKGDRPVVAETNR